MKKLLIAATFIFCFVRLNAQTEVKLSPIPLLFGYVAVSVEQQVNPDFGVDLDLYLIEDFFGGNLSAKYYFNPDRGIDKFHVGAFGGVQYESVGVGFLAGYKWLSRKNITFELGLGIGRSFDDGAIGYAKFHLGYRFEKKAK